MSLKKRVIVVLFYKNGKIVQSYNFSRFKVVGNSTYIVKRVNQWDLDELIFLDISDEDHQPFVRKDIPQAVNFSFQNAIDSMSTNTYAPLAAGGRIKTLDQVHEYLLRGADKVVINSVLFDDTQLLQKIIRTFGSQVLIAAVDYRREEVRRIYKHGGKEKTNWLLKDWLIRLQEMGVGEILLNSIDNDGNKNGFDLEVSCEIPEDFEVPVILLGGAGGSQHFMEALKLQKIHSVAAGNFFLHEDQSYHLLKKLLVAEKVNVRNSTLYLEELKKT